ncbi:MAG: hypothetical protein QUS13_03370 [Smithella sp.]|nr:hypothetical protein [Smithella sp.]
MNNNIINKNESSHKEFPLVELGENKQNNFSRITKSIKDVLASLRMTIEEENSDNDEFNLITSHNDGELKVMVYISYKTDHDLISIRAYYGDVPKNKRKKAAELINLMNIKFIHSRIVMIPNSGDVEIDSEIIIAKWFNPKELSISLKLLFANGSCYFTAIGILMTTNETPVSIIDLLDKGIQKLRNKKKKDFLKTEAGKTTEVK